MIVKEPPAPVSVSVKALRSANTGWPRRSALSVHVVEAEGSSVD